MAEMPVIRTSSLPAEGGTHLITLIDQDGLRLVEINGWVAGETWISYLGPRLLEYFESLLQVLKECFLSAAGTYYRSILSPLTSRPENKESQPFWKTKSVT